MRRSQDGWLAVRAATARRGRELSELAAWLYPESARARGGHVLAGPGWLPDTLIPLHDVRLEFDDTPLAVPPLTAPLDDVLPLTDRGERYHSYSRAVRDLVRPRLLENRVSYRLLGVHADGGLALRFGTTTLFEVFDAKECVAHEFKAAFLRSKGSVPRLRDLPIRAGVVDPFDPGRWLMSPGISTLTIRHDPRAGHRFVLHQRDSSAVADGGGMCAVMPSGEFQPSTTATVDVRNDFSLWHNIMREYSEEFLGDPEHDGAGTRAIDYARDEPFAAFGEARAAGAFRVWHCGLVMDALTLGPTQRTVAVIDAPTYDALFRDLVHANDEGHLVGEGGRIDMPFTADAVDRLQPRMSSGSASLLRMAWHHRRLLLGD
ncbi:XRE family transcriptional regulator [Actinokineospora pegani]|uniref:XRE family transcriptional regulator n=1 Tax=Actinokineospora pegani TaxID=2654637 RepID=UPI0012EA499E|nr:XRE family transcriptional regulator [Actinokineospora pegani]